MELSDSVKSKGLTISPSRFERRKRTVKIQLKRDGGISNGKIAEYKSEEFELACVVHKKTVDLSVSMVMDNKLMNAFFRMCTRIAARGYDNPMALGLYGTSNPTKEVLESAAGYHYIMQFLRSLSQPEYWSDRDQFDLDTKNKETICICVGDGISPKTAYLFAATAHWQVISVDPEMRDQWLTSEKKGIPGNLTCHKSKMEDVDLTKFNFKRVIIAAVHSHANLDHLWRRIDTFQEKICLSIPCCAGFVHEVENVKPVRMLTELEIPSLKNKILIWHVKSV